MIRVPVETCLAELEIVLERLRATIYEQVAPLDVEAWVTPEPVGWAERRSGTRRALGLGESWGSLFDCAWFRFTAQIPDPPAAGDLVALIDVNGELLVVDGEGLPFAGLTCKASTFDAKLGRPAKTVLRLTTAHCRNDRVEIWADAGCNDLFGNHVDRGRVREASIARCRAPLKDLSYDLEVLLDWLRNADRHGSEYRRILDGCLEAALMLPLISDQPAALGEALRLTRALLQETDGKRRFSIDAIGHAHIDLAWLWPLRETRRKAARTFATALDLIDRYPEYRFGMGQPQLYQWIKEDHPALYRRIRDGVAVGRIEPQGVTWVEADLNATGAESLVRQLLYGRRYFRDEFGVTPDYLWEPDAFGYPASLPQILAKSGVRYFASQKMSWNDYNSFPHHSFVWRGIDGSHVLSHFFPEDTYNGPAAPCSVLKIQRDYRQIDTSSRALMVFGIGDGGGGPGEEHLERLRRLDRLPGFPRVTQRWAQEFFNDLAREASSFPVWQGELYLERHQGTYTSQSSAKRNNRELETLLRQVEFAASLAGDPVAYPRGDLERIWKEVLLYQFHDILPGSSIRRVYEESGARYAALRGELTTLLERILTRTAQAVDTSSARRPLVVFNPLSWDRRVWVDAGGSARPIVAPALGYVVVDRDAPPAADQVRPTATATAIENEHLRVAFAEDGSITSLFDKRQNLEYVRSGETTHHYTIYHDLRDAWDFVPQYRTMPSERLPLVSVEPFAGDSEAGVVQLYRHGASQLEVRIGLTAGESLVRFSCRLDWREANRMLKVAVPVAVRASEASCGIQFGNVRRPTHSTTSWDAAKDEVPAWWADLSDATHGIALLNDGSKYGHRVKDCSLELSLVRSPPYPGGVKVEKDDPDYVEKAFLDIGRQEFTYALLPHAGSAERGEVVRVASELSVPACQVTAESHPGELPASWSLASVSDPAIIVESVKQAEDGDETVLRLYESTGGRRRVCVHVANATGAYETNLMEEHLGDLELVDNTVELDFQPFEIRTLMVRRLPM